MTKQTASEFWTALEDDAIDAEMEAVLAMTPDERRRELREAGFDLEALHAQADALRAPPPRPKRKRLAIVLPGTVALAAGVLLAVHLASAPEPVGHARLDPRAARAGALRQEARNACDARSWQTCLDRLNEAQTIDSSGEQIREVQSLRRVAQAAGPSRFPLASTMYTREPTHWLGTSGLSCRASQSSQIARGRSPSPVRASRSRQTLCHARFGKRP